MRKLTAVTVRYNNKKIQAFLMLENGVLPRPLLDKMLNELRVPIGGTFTVG